jgi:hypothetical protein
MPADSSTGIYVFMSVQAQWNSALSEQCRSLKRMANAQKQHVITIRERRLPAGFGKIFRQRKAAKLAALPVFHRK